MIYLTSLIIQEEKANGSFKPIKYTKIAFIFLQTIAVTIRNL